jgi:hypothetical protein
MIKPIPDYSRIEIDNVLDQVRKYNREIGEYQQHVVNQEDSSYTVKLTNGVIRLYLEEIEDKQTLIDFRLKDIAARFRNTFHHE